MTTENQQHPLSGFPFTVPAGYRWLIDRGLVGFEADTALQPWYFLPVEQVFSVSERWPRATELASLYAFARRQDCDDIACFAVEANASQPGVVVVHGWTPEGYEVVARFDSIWAWLRSVVADVEEWVALGEE
ncbi:MAG: hypothetical protein K8W52_10850 [Deltaproteobacteria bacterium]|nr:hypothetical protein [Deltaproteobacteria bacterium]